MLDEVSVILPTKSKQALVYGPTKASLELESEDFGRETFSIPLSLAKSLVKELKNDPDCFSSQGRNEFLHILKQKAVQDGYQRVIKLIARRDYSEHDLRKKLQDFGYVSSVIDEVIAKAEAACLINDQRFAEVFIRSKLYAGMAERLIARKLSEHGIELDNVKGWPEEFDLPDPYERALELLAYKSASGKDPVNKFARFLINRGYSPGIAFQAARAHMEELETEELEP